MPDLTGQSHITPAAAAAAAALGAGRPVGLVPATGGPRLEAGCQQLLDRVSPEGDAREDGRGVASHRGRPPSPAGVHVQLGRRGFLPRGQRQGGRRRVPGGPLWCLRRGRQGVPVRRRQRPGAGRSGRPRVCAEHRLRECTAEEGGRGGRAKGPCRRAAGAVRACARSGERAGRAPHLPHIGPRGRRRRPASAPLRGTANKRGRAHTPRIPSHAAAAPSPVCFALTRSLVGTLHPPLPAGGWNLISPSFATRRPWPLPSRSTRSASRWPPQPGLAAVSRCWMPWQCTLGCHLATRQQRGLGRCHRQGAATKMDGLPRGRWRRRRRPVIDCL